MQLQNKPHVSEKVVRNLNMNGVGLGVTLHGSIILNMKDR